MNSKMMELLSEISHETAKGILSGTEEAAQAALEKIHAAIASALPVDHHDGEGAVATHEYRTPLLKANKRVATTPQTIVFETALAHGRKLSAQWSSESTSSNATADLWDGNKHVAGIMFYTQYQGRSWGSKITRHALKGLASKAGHASRNRRNKKEVA